MSLREKALSVRENAYTPYSNFKVGAAITAEDGQTYIGCNVENVAYPEGTCAEAGAIASMIASGQSKITEVYVVANAPVPVSPCGGCRQKLIEFGSGDVVVTMATVDGIEKKMTLSELMPGAFTEEHLENT